LKTRQIFALKVVVSAILLSIVLYRTNFSAIVDSIRGADLNFLLVALSLNFVGAILTSTRWSILTKAHGVEVSVSHYVSCWMVAVYFNQFLPSTVGGDAVRIYDTSRLGLSKTTSTAVIVTDRLLGLIVLLGIGLVAVVVGSTAILTADYLLWACAALFTVVSIAVVSIRYAPAHIGALTNRVSTRGPLKKVYGFVDRFASALGVYKDKPGVLAIAVLISILLQLNVILFYYFIGLSLDLNVTLLQFATIIPIANVLMLLPITINGVGLREPVFALLLGAYGVAAATAVAFAWCSFFLFLLYGLTGGIVFALRSEHQLPKVQE
jgi:uncharacterized protein (TIRG00374 family)